MPCEFCNNPALVSRIVYKDDVVFVVVGNMPIVPGHLLVCPVRHVTSIDDLRADELQAIHSRLVVLKNALKKMCGAEGFNYAWNEGVLAGQSVPHLHVHMLPRRSGDTGIYEYEPRKFLYRPGSRATTPDQELIAAAEELRVLLKEE
jgi:histidine triad (HIT) family protein